MLCVKLCQSHIYAGSAHLQRCFVFFGPISVSNRSNWRFGRRDLTTAPCPHFDNPDFVYVVIHSYRHRFRLRRPRSDLEAWKTRWPPSRVIFGTDDRTCMATAAASLLRKAPSSTPLLYRPLSASSDPADLRHNLPRSTGRLGRAVLELVARNEIERRLTVLRPPRGSWSFSPETSPGGAISAEPIRCSRHLCAGRIVIRFPTSNIFETVPPPASHTISSFLERVGESVAGSVAILTGPKTPSKRGAGATAVNWDSSVTRDAARNPRRPYPRE